MILVYGIKKVLDNIGIEQLCISENMERYWRIDVRVYMAIVGREIKKNLLENTLLCDLITTAIIVSIIDKIARKYYNWIYFCSLATLDSRFWNVFVENIIYHL